MSEWVVGDRVIVALRNQHSWRAECDEVWGVVADIDIPGQPPGVLVQFVDPPVFNGLTTCYATHSELRKAR
jgi:hypothetical protein